MSVPTNKAWRLTASTREALSKRVLRAVIVDCNFVSLTANLVDRVQDYIVAFDPHVGVRTTAMINEIDILTTKVSIMTDLYSSFACHF